jgi:polyisoprenoid-binding protein YceI
MKTRPLIIALLALAAAAPAQEAATEYHVTSAFPKYVTADIEFRDPSGAKWPKFFYGKPANESGRIVFDPAKPAANFALLYDQMAQDKGDQSRKVLGELPHPLTAALTITAMGAIEPVAKSKDKSTHTAELAGTLEIAGRKIPVKAPASFRRHDGKGDEKNPALMLDAQFTIRAATLGLKAPGDVAVRFGLTAYPPRTAPQ